MAYLNIDLDYFDHPKTKRLVGLLGRGSEGLPIRLWCYCGKYHAENGQLKGYLANELETLIGWWGQPGKAVEALIRVGFLEAVADGFKVHDWEKINGHIAAFKARAQAGAAEKWRKVRAQADAQAMLKHNSSNAASNAPQEESEDSKDPNLGISSLGGVGGEPSSLGDTVRLIRKNAVAVLQDKVLLSLDLWMKDFPGFDIPGMVQKTIKVIEGMETPPADPVAFFLDHCRREQAHRKALGLELAEQVIQYFNAKTGKRFKANTTGTVSAIRARQSEGYEFEDFKIVIDNKTADWLHDPRMEKHLNPDTLFRPSNFEKYRNQINSGVNHGQNGSGRGNPVAYESAADKQERANAEFLRDLEAERGGEHDSADLHVGSEGSPGEGLRYPPARN